MEVIPAIDIKSGRCVRLYQGDYGKETVFSENPVEVAGRWEEEGAPRLHVVDLDGAATGHPVNSETIGAIAAQVRIPLQVGGGVRSIEAAERLFAIGVERVVLGTAAVRDPDLVGRLSGDWGKERVVVAVDARGGRVAVAGWKEDTSMDPCELVLRMEALGAGRFLYTDISRDGTLTEPDFDGIGALVRASGRPVLASGGVSRAEHLVRLAAVGAEGAIVGVALYTGTIDLREALGSVATGP